MTILAAQFLELIPGNLTSAQASECLKRAFDILPLTHILLGWEVARGMEAVIAEETACEQCSTLPVVSSSHRRKIYTPHLAHRQPAWQAHPRSQ